MLTVKSLSGQVAFVQGGSRGIGAAIVKRLARDGTAVAFTYVSSASKAEEIVATITAAGGKALASIRSWVGVNLWIGVGIVVVLFLG